MQNYECNYSIEHYIGVVFILKILKYTGLSCNILKVNNISEVLEMLNKNYLKKFLMRLESVFLLFFMIDKTSDDVATITGVTASNIKVKLHRIRKKLFFVLKGMEEQ